MLFREITVKFGVFFGEFWSVCIGDFLNDFCVLDECKMGWWSIGGKCRFNDLRVVREESCDLDG